MAFIGKILDAGHLCDVIAPALFREKQVSEFLSKFGDAQPPGLDLEGPVHYALLS
jgi:hypothetical protein